MTRPRSTDHATLQSIGSPFSAPWLDRLIRELNETVASPKGKI